MSLLRDEIRGKSPSVLRFEYRDAMVDKIAQNIGPIAPTSMRGDVEKQLDIRRNWPLLQFVDFHVRNDGWCSSTP